MTVLSNSLVLPNLSSTYLSSGSLSKSVDLCPGNGCLYKSSFKTNRRTSQRALAVQASYSDGGRPSSGGIFISGFVLGGIIVGTLGAVYAPQISKALAGADKKDLMRKLPKFIYDEEKALERTRKILSEKIEQLNSAIDDVSAQLRTEDSPNGVAVSADEIEATT
ncbi:Localized to the inner membrane of the chloroplast [Heracleum sosnowskyi]|uniref:Localized to the inner membrane of the chloroplast n=1 Tax=Heracleum sosnowskyi TaxID=360622 RepID=A0AAD8IQK9_9APIA|nr:Localized to the inner membrane of the chloroplast [Heracleum sosnowskyi]